MMAHSPQPPLDRLPLVAVRCQLGLCDGAVQRVPLLGTDAAVLGEEVLVVGFVNSPGSV